MSTTAPLTRRTSASSSPFEPDWLLQRHLARDVAAALRLHARGRLLDVGCGERPYRALVPPGVLAFGVDAAPALGGEADVLGLAGALPFDAETFDTVLCTQALEHVPDPGAAVSEAARVLRPGGRLILTAPQTWSLHEEPHDYWRFTRYGLLALCHQAGLRPLELRAQGGFFAVAGLSLTFQFVACARWLAERGRPAARGAPPAWRRLLAPLRLPLAAVNLCWAALDRLPQPGVFAVNHLLVAERPHTADGAPP